MKTKNEKRTVFRFPFFYENVKRMKVLKIQTKNLLNMKITVNYLNFVFRVEAKTKSKDRINYLDFVFRVEVKTKSKDRILNSFFNLSKTRNGTLGTRIQ